MEVCVYEVVTTSYRVISSSTLLGESLIPPTCLANMMVIFDVPYFLK